MRNPTWTRDEVILALDLYFRLGRRQLDATHADVLGLSELMQRLPYHPRGSRAESFRNTNGISMILGNFLGIDPENRGAGLGRNNRLQQEVWDEFAGDPDRLRRIAVAIAAGVGLMEAGTIGAGLPEEETFPEGRLLTSLHLQRERNRRAVARKKREVMEEAGKLECEACGFDFERTYGVVGKGFAECHHTVPLAELPFVRVTSLADLAVVCANCHRMLHRARPVLDVGMLRALVSRRAAT